MKKNLLKKFSAFIVPTISGAMLFSASANAQIVYTDVNPDSTKTCSIYSPVSGTNSSMYNFDINNDGVFDLKLDLSVSRSPGGKVRSGFVKVSPINGSAIRTDTSGFPLKMNLNDVIDSSGSASMASGQIMISRSQSFLNPPVISGNWITATDGFIGFKIVSGSQSYYCWVRLNVEVVLGNANPVTASFTIKDYAYNSIPNQFILAGDTGTGPTGIIETSFASSINLFPNPTANHFTITLPNANKKVEVTIADITGKIIYSTTISEAQKVEVNTSNFAAGVYVVQIQSADFIGTKKLVIEK